jgi:hypothetical protein
MYILMISLERTFENFKEFISSNLELGLDEKYRDNKDLKKDLKKEPKKEIPSFNAITPQYLFRVEEKVDIKPYQGDIDVVKMNQWL